MSLLQFAARVPALLTDRADALADICLDYGDVVKVPVPGKPLHLVTRPDFLRHVLVTNSKNYTTGVKGFQPIVSTFLGDGLITTHGEVWQHARRAAMPAFRQKYVQNLTDAVIREVEQFVSTELAALQTTFTETHGQMAKLSLRLFAKTMLSVDVRRDEETILHAMHVALRNIDRRLAALIDFDAWLPAMFNGRFLKAKSEVDVIFGGWIADRTANPTDTDDLMNMLLRASGDLEENERAKWMRDQIITVLSAGHETVAAALAWGLLLLARNPEVQERVRAEYAEKVGADGLTGESLKELTYTSAVVEEILRLYPSVWSFGREAIAEDRLGDAIIPAGATVMLCPYALHRRPDLWPEPLKFMPERFLGDEPPAPFTFLPFSVGPRSCVGDHLSRLELKVGIATLAGRFHIDRPNDRPVRKEPLISLRPEPDFDMRFRCLRSSA